MSSQISSHLQTFIYHFRTSLSHQATDLDVITAKNADDYITLSLTGLYSSLSKDTLFLIVLDSCL